MPLLTPEEVRALGALVEKAITTPEYYPLSLAALTNACNQLTSRDPILSLEESQVSRAMDGLRDKRLATIFHGAESRVAKYRHLLNDAYVLTPAEVAVLCVLMLRGPQTVGELRGRTERLHRFDSLAEVEEALAGLVAHTPEPLAMKLPRQPGTKESRYTHLLGGSPAASVQGGNEAPARAATPAEAQPDRIAKLEEETAALRRELDELRNELGKIRSSKLGIG